MESISEKRVYCENMAREFKMLKKEEKIIILGAMDGINLFNSINEAKLKNEQKEKTRIEENGIYFINRLLEEGVNFTHLRSEQNFNSRDIDGDIFSAKLFAGVDKKLDSVQIDIQIGKIDINTVSKLRQIGFKSPKSNKNILRVRLSKSTRSIIIDSLIEACVNSLNYA